MLGGLSSRLQARDGAIETELGILGQRWTHSSRPDLLPCESGSLAADCGAAHHRFRILLAVCGVEQLVLIAPSLRFSCH